MSTLPNPFEPADLTSAEPSRFVLDVARFMEAIEPPPLFLQQPPVRADELIGVLAVLAGH